METFASIYCLQRVHATQSAVCVEYIGQEERKSERNQVINCSTHSEEDGLKIIKLLRRKRSKQKLCNL